MKALVCDVDGTITDERRRISTNAIICIRKLLDNGVPVVIASGNTTCSVDIICKMIGTSGEVIVENGGCIRAGFGKDLMVLGNRKVCWEAYTVIEEHFSAQGKSLTLYSPQYRFADVAFARDVEVNEVRKLVEDLPVRILDSGFAVHIQSEGLNKGVGLKKIAPLMNLSPGDFMAVGDSTNDIEMLENAGIGVAVGNADEKTREAADYTVEKRYGDGFVEAVSKYFIWPFSKDSDPQQHNP